jgi:hypothetical protein
MSIKIGNMVEGGEGGEEGVKKKPGTLKNVDIDCLQV